MALARNGIQRLKWLIRFQGASGTVLTLLHKLFNLNRFTVSLAHSCLRKKEMLFDARFKIETTEKVAVEHLGVADEQAASALEYDPTSPVRFLDKISSLAINYRDYVFLDLGSGKGRVILLASEFPFKQVNGVEISRRLHQIANQNIVSYNSKSRRCRNVRSICCDVASYVLPCEPTVIYLFNPFHGQVLESLLSNIRRSLLQSPRHLIIVYFNPVQRQLFDRVDFLELRESSDANWAIYDTAGCFRRASENCMSNYLWLGGLISGLIPASW